jgi:hypothetical protein
MTSLAFPIGNMYKCPEPAHVNGAWRFSGAAQASAAFGGTSGARGGIPMTVPDFLMSARLRQAPPRCRSHREPAGGSPG